MKEQTAHPSAEVPVDESLFARVADEIFDRMHLGEQPNVDDYIVDHPELADLLHGIMPALEVMCGSLPAAGDGGSAAKPAAQPATTIAGRLGDFEIRSEIGRGSMGVVYEATQLSLNRPVALKVLPFAGVLDAKRLQRFKNEAQAAGQLHHPSIVPVFFVGSERGVHFYAMQLIEGQSLAEVISDLRGGDTEGGSADTISLSPSGSTARRRGDAPTRTEKRPAPLSSGSSRKGGEFFNVVARLGVQAARALDHAHTLGILHRDIKPSNLLIDTTGNLWVSDFGLARFPDDASLTATGDLLGTLAYMSPEAARGNQAAVDQRSDIYSLGASLYQLLTLHHLFPTTSNRLALLQKITKDEPRSLRSYDAAIPLDLETIVLKTLAKERGERYASAGELADDLQRFLDKKPILARRPSLMDRAVKWTRRHRTFVVAALATLILLTIGSVAASLLILKEQLKTAAALEQKQQAFELAESHRQEAVASEARARQMSRLTRQAVDDMYTNVARILLVDQPHMTGTEQEFLEKALAIYETLSDEEPDDFDTALGCAMAALRAGKIHYALGHYEQAESHLRRALDRLGRLAEQYPNHHGVTAGQAEVEQALARLLGDLGQLPAATEMFQSSLGKWTRIVADHADREYQQQLMSARIGLANILSKLGRENESEQLLRQAVDLGLGWLGEDGSGAPGCRYTLVIAYENLAQLANASDEPQAALKLLEQCSPHVQACLAADPRHRGYRLAARSRHTIAATAFMKLGQYAAAERSCREASHASESLAKDFPTIPDYQDLFAQDGVLLAAALLRQGKADEASQVAHRAQAALEQLCGRPAAAGRYRSDLAYLRNQMATIAAALDRSEQAVEHFEAAIEIQRKVVADEPNVPQHRRQLAGILADYAWFRSFSLDEAQVDLPAARELAEQTLVLDPTSRTARIVGVATDYCRNEWQSAVREADDLLQSSCDEEGTIRLYLAMALAKLGESTRASEEFLMAEKLVDKRGFRDQYQERLMSDAREILAERQGAAARE